MRWDHISDDIKIRYNLHSMAHGDYIYIKIEKGMYGLKEVAILAYKKFSSIILPEATILFLAQPDHGSIKQGKQSSVCASMISA